MLDDTRVINGSFGECHSEGKWLTNIYKMSADVEPSYGDVKMSGTRRTGQKLLRVQAAFPVIKSQRSWFRMLPELPMTGSRSM